MYLFGQRIGRLSVATRSKLIAIAKANGAQFYYATGRDFSGAKGWFGCKNMGDPFDSATAKAVRDAVTAAGIEYFADSE